MKWQLEVLIGQHFLMKNLSSTPFCWLNNDFKWLNPRQTTPTFLEATSSPFWDHLSHLSRGRSQSSFVHTPGCHQTWGNRRMFLLKITSGIFSASCHGWQFCRESWYAAEKKNWQKGNKITSWIRLNQALKPVPSWKNHLNWHWKIGKIGISMDIPLVNSSIAIDGPCKFTFNRISYSKNAGDFSLSCGCRSSLGGLCLKCQLAAVLFS